MKETYFELNRDRDTYRSTHILSNGQICEIRFFYWEYKNFDEFSIGFAVANKKKQLSKFFSEDSDARCIDLQSTGTCGIEALLWARQQIEEFEELIAIWYEEDGNTRPIRITVHADDNRRFRVYRRGLQKLGYTETMTDCGRAMVKMINCEGD